MEENFSREQLLVQENMGKDDATLQDLTTNDGTQDKISEQAHQKTTEQNKNEKCQTDMAQKDEQSSLLTKFKDRLELEKAYVNLEREFTKKCQELKSLKENTCDNASAPQEQKNLEQKFNDFLEQNPVAKQFAEEIKNNLDKDKAGSDSLERAFEKVKANHFKTNEEMLNDSDFVENYVLKNSSITDKIITNYLSTVASNQVTPLMSNFGGGSVMITPKSKPTSLKEAGDYVVALINNK